MYIKINKDNPDRRKINQIIDILNKGGVIIYPTDTVYGLGCSIHSQKAIEKICRIRGLDPKKANLSFIVENMSQLAEYCNQISTPVFKLLKRNLPGPFTFILKANNKAPKLLKNKKKTVGIRIPDNEIVSEIVRELGHPIITTSLKSDDEITEYFTDASEIYDDFENLVDVVIDGGFGNNVPSTIVDCISDDFEIIRQGMGELK